MKPTLQRLPTDNGIAYEAKVSGPDHMTDLIEDVLHNAPVETIRLFTRLTPRELLAVRPDERAAHQLWSGQIRLPVSNASSSTERQFKDKVGRQIAALIEQASERRIGTWRVVGASITQAHRVRWTRQPTGLSRRDVEIPDERMGENEVRQVTRAVEVKDPVLLLNVALAEVTGAKPVDQAWTRDGRPTSAYYGWIQEGAKEYMTPPRERRARDEARAVLVAMFGEDACTVERPPMTEEQQARVVQLLKLGLSVAEVARAVGAMPEEVEKLAPPAKVKP